LKERIWPHTSTSVPLPLSIRAFAPLYQYGTEARIQLNDSFKTTNDIRDFIAAERDAMSEADRQLMQVSIKADEDARMGIVTDVKQELRRCSALKIMYAARKTEKK